MLGACFCTRARTRGGGVGLGGGGRERHTGGMHPAGYVMRSHGLGDLTCAQPREAHAATEYKPTSIA